MLNEVFEGALSQHLTEKYASIKKQNKYSTDSFVMVMNKLEEILAICHEMGKQFKYKFRSYVPGFVASDPWFFYFNTEEDLKDYLPNCNRYWKKDGLEVNWQKRDRNGYQVTNRDQDRKFIIGFIDETKTDSN